MGLDGGPLLAYAGTRSEAIREREGACEVGVHDEGLELCAC